MKSNVPELSTHLHHHHRCLATTPSSTAQNNDSRLQSQQEIIEYSEGHRSSRNSSSLLPTVLVTTAYCHGDDRANNNSLQITTSNVRRRTRREITNNERILSSLAAGAIAGAIAKTTIAPLDRTKIYFQTTPSTPFSARNVLKYVYKSYKSTGFTSLWRGNSATMARIVPYAAIQFSAHDQFKRVFGTDRENTHEITRFLCGSLAGVVAQSLTYPLDLTRARLAVSSNSQYTSLADVFVKTVKTEGPLGLYKGYIPTMIGVVPYAGCSFYCYESLKRLWKRKFGEDSVSGFERLCFGAISGIIGQSSSYPLDIVRRRLQTGVVEETIQNGRFKVFRMLVYIAKTEGVVRGLYKGLSMNWIKGPVAAGISFAMFDWSQLVLMDLMLKRDSGGGG